MTKLRSLVFAAFLALPFTASFAQVEFSVGWAPPPLPVVVQPACPVAGYMWTPGYWGWDDYYYDYYWVPGVWVPPPRIGLLWTPGWWGWRNGAYAFNQGYWGSTVGFYGGVNYGFGYTGNGYWGGRWSGNTFQYNTAITRVNKTIINNNTYVNNNFNKNVNVNRTSFNGGNNGIKAEPNAEQRNAMANAKKEGPTSQQLERQKLASKDQNLRALVNKGKPNQEAIKSFDKNERVGQGKGGQQVEDAGGARAGQGANERGPMSQHKEGADVGAGKGAGKAGNENGNVAERRGQGAGGGAEGGADKPGKGHDKVAGNDRLGAGAGNGAEQGNKMGGGGTENHGNRTGAGNKNKMHGNANGPGHQNSMNQQMKRQQQMNAQHHQQQMMGMGGGQKKMGGQNQMRAQGRPPGQGSGNHPKQGGGQQQQGK